MKQARSCFLLPPGLNPKFLASPYLYLLIQPLVTLALWSEALIWCTSPPVHSFSRTPGYPWVWDRHLNSCPRLGLSPHPSLMVAMNEQSKLRGLPTTRIIILVETTLIISKTWYYLLIMAKHVEHESTAHDTDCEKKAHSSFWETNKQNINLQSSSTRPYGIAVFSYCTLILTITYEWFALDVWMLGRSGKGAGFGVACFQGEHSSHRAFRSIIYETGTKKRCPVDPAGLSSEPMWQCLWNVK